MLLASRIRVPDDTGALLWDLDGVVLDTLSMEYGVVRELVAEEVPAAPEVPLELVRRSFALAIPDFWRAILGELGSPAPDGLVARLTDRLEQARATGHADVHAGVRELLDAARAEGLRVAVVSNNPAGHVDELLRTAGLRERFEAIVGNDQGLPGKPAPDMYLAGAAAVGLLPQQCVALEDSLLGAQAARAAGCVVVGVATGAARFAELEAAPTVDVAYRAFTPSTAVLRPGDVTAKTLDTPNEFVSHMLEHIAWRTGCAMTLQWETDDWDWLGQAVGEQLSVLLDGAASESRALGLIDDGSCEVTLERTRADAGLVVFTGHAAAAGDTDAERLLAMRVEQLADGRPLAHVLEGLARACGLRIRVEIASLEDPHHTWEAIFRAVGVALRGLSRTLTDHADGTGVHAVAADGERAAKGYGLRIESASPEAVRAVRTTAESVCVADVSLADGPLTLELATSEAVHCDGLIELVARLGAAAGLAGVVDFSALELSSSHVVAEDVGMTLGAALKELATERMNAFGIEGAGSSIPAAGAVHNDRAPIRVGVSWEGRKFLQLVPLGWTREQLRDQLIGGTLASGLFTEDLDDFLDGFVGGMGCSVVVHWEPVADLDAAWELVFSGLGAALRGLLAPNHAKRALIAGVKATLA
ncbi:MAG: hypothetical protein JWM31_1549 [Solirubrobacterales bacterium]|nr:hypothetical protein [Solirubrobacterales bacterium]